MNVNSRILFEEVLIPLYTNRRDIVKVRGEDTIELLNHTAKFDGSESGLINIFDIFKTSEQYIEKEMKWYDSQNPNSEYIAEHAQIWSTASDENGMTNSNYGFLMYSPQNGYQYKNVVRTLKKDPQSRRAIAYYTNPFMHYVGDNDHICTMYVSYTIRLGKLHAFVSMRSNDARFGLIGADLAWQIHMLRKIAIELNVGFGSVHWHAVSLHLYKRHWEQLENIMERLMNDVS